MMSMRKKFTIALVLVMYVPLVIGMKNEKADKEYYFPDITGFAPALAFQPNGKYLAGTYLPGGGTGVGPCEYQAGIILFEVDEKDTTDFTLTKLLDEKEMGLYSLVFNSQGTVLAAAGKGEKPIRLWNVERIINNPGKESSFKEFTCSSHYSAYVICALAFNEKGTKLAGLLNDHEGTIVAWDIKTKKQCKAKGAYRDWFNATMTKPDGTQDVSGKVIDSIQSWDSETIERINKLGQANMSSPPLKNAYVPIAYNENGKHVQQNPKFKLEKVDTGALSSDGAMFAKSYAASIDLYYVDK